MLVAPVDPVDAGLDDEIGVIGFEDEADTDVGAALAGNDDVVGGGGMLVVLV